jgi:hypothetical protein
MNLMLTHHAMSNLIDNVKKNMLEFKQISPIKEKKEVYRELLATVMDSVYGTTLRRFHNPVLGRMEQNVRELCQVPSNTIKQGYYTSWICEILSKACGTMSRDTKHVIVCDALALHDILFVTYEFEEKTRTFLTFNPGGKTRTYEYLIKNCHELKGFVTYYGGEITLNLVGQAIAKSIGASYEKYDKFDRLVHSIGSQNDFESLLESLYNVIEELVAIVRRRIDANFSVLVLADHGYDINPQTLTLTHQWDPGGQGCLSILAPFMVVTQNDRV